LSITGTPGTNSLADTEMTSLFPIICWGFFMRNIKHNEPHPHLYHCSMTGVGTQSKNHSQEFWRKHDICFSESGLFHLTYDFYQVHPFLCK
jgi:hypothetical protein